jgi:uncharacterized membrane protein YidH (DUF202 family)
MAEVLKRQEQFSVQSGLIIGREIMSRNRLIGFVLLAVGIVLLVMGYNAAQSVGSQFKQAFTGSMSDKATLLYLGGAIVSAVGAYLAFLSRK